MPVRVAEVIGRLSHVRYSLRGVLLLVHRMGWSPRMSVHRAVERGEVVVTCVVSVFSCAGGRERRPVMFTRGASCPGRCGLLSPSRFCRAPRDRGEGPMCQGHSRS
ncbi:helix-turn-helix domain-containing protein [Streptosporangium sp. H16]|uniref:helix-turn-helix domain-containing protein n=1 Tax=Streptosporangium sp. H16 TaxID=3444184 RepID=UPI003F7998A9